MKNPRILSRGLSHKVQERIKRNKSAKYRNKYNIAYLSSGISKFFNKGIELKSSLTENLELWEEAKNVSNLVSTSFEERDENAFYEAFNQAGTSVYRVSEVRRIPYDKKVAPWLEGFFDYYFMTSDTSGVGYIFVAEGGDKDDTTNFVRFTYTDDSKSIRYNLTGRKDLVERVEKMMALQDFPKDEVAINWLFGMSYREMDTFKLPLNIPPSIPGAYPWLKQSIHEFASQFMNSSSNILILIGPPGTGKTTFIKELIKECKTEAIVTYETKLLFSDGFFAQFMTDAESDLLILEDADEIMGSRTDGNTMMHKLLNAADGLVSIRHKKIIFTTNLPSVSDIDPALIRKGRCFDVLNFRDLSFEEAKVVAEHVHPGKELPYRRTYSLAEVVNLDESSREVPKNKVGFCS